MGLYQWDVDYNSLRRYYTGECLFFVVEHPGDASGLRQLDDIRQFAAETSERAGGGQARGEGWLNLPGGAVAGVLVDVEWDDALEWLNVFTSALGTGGSLRGGPRGRSPRLTGPHSLEPPHAEPVVRCAYTLREHSRDYEWGLDTDLTRLLAAEAANWTVLPRSKVYFDYGTSALVVDTDLTEPIVEAQQRLGSCEVHAERSATQSHSYALRGAGMDYFGETSYWWWDTTLSWDDKLPQLMRTLLCAPQRLDYAFIAHSVSARWISGNSVPWPNEISSAYFDGLKRQSLTCMAPDAFGIQVLRQAHLERARDLSDWSVEPLGEERFLVTHPQVSLWYAETEPPDDLLGQAREDFGEMLMTPDRVAALIKE